jgi:hypothetical protein
MFYLLENFLEGFEGFLELVEDQARPHGLVKTQKPRWLEVRQQKSQLWT